MAKLTLTDITSGYAALVKYNANNDLLEAALENTLSRDGTTPNHMNASLDMNSQRIINLPAPGAGSDAARWSDITSALSLTGVAIPSLSGSTGKRLTNDGTNLAWGDLYFNITSAEALASVTPSSLAFPPGHLYRYGATGDGSTNDRTAIQNAIEQAEEVGGAPVFVPEAVSYFKVTGSALTLRSGILIYGAGYKARIKMDTAETMLFAGSALTNVTLMNMRLSGVASTTEASILVSLQGCVDVDIDNITFDTMSWAGVDMRTGAATTAQRIRVRNCRFKDFATPVNGSTGVNFYSSTRDCLVENCEFAGGATNGSTGADFGISMFESSGAGTCLDNTLRGNRLRGFKKYGIVLYGFGGSHRNHTVTGNNIQDVYGGGDTPGSGMGIYLASCAADISHNYIKNVLNSSDGSLVPGAIGLNAVTDDTLVIGNKIDDSGWHGIMNVGQLASARVNIANNKINRCIKKGIYSLTSSNVIIVGNHVRHVTAISTEQALHVLGEVGTHITNVVVSGNIFNCITAQDIVIQYVDGLTFTGNIGSTTQTSGTFVTIADCSDVVMSGSQLLAPASSGVALSVSAVLRMKMSANNIASNGTAGFATTGTCTGSHADATNRLSGVVTNAATGFTIEFYATAAPGSGTYAVGDRQWDSDIAAGGAAGSICTTAGTPGTWKAMAAVAA